VAVASLLLGSTGCGKKELTGTAGKDIKILPANTLPRELAGLTVKQENVAKATKQAKHSYVDAVGFYTLRQDKRVQGTVQVSRFNDSARLEDADFKTELVQRTSPGTPVAINVGNTTVQQSTGTKSTVSIWFSKGRMIVLTVLLAYTGSRGLLEQALVELPAT